MTVTKFEIGIEEIQAASERIKPYIKRTDVVVSPSINEQLNAHCYFKQENVQAAGAFKSRGACNVVFSLSDSEAKCGVVTHSSGNHAAALARAAQLRGIPAHVVMPEDSVPQKIANVRSFNGQITFCRPTLEDREAVAGRIQTETGATMVHPYDDWRIIAGAGTAALELIDDVPQLDLIVAPIGGGGLISGCALVAASQDPAVEVWGAEPVAADDAWQSRRRHQVVAQTCPTTQADGLRTSLGIRTWTVIAEYVPKIILSGETKTRHWARQLTDQWHAPVETSSAVPIAALMAYCGDLTGRQIGVILSGGNVPGI